MKYSLSQKMPIITIYIKNIKKNTKFCAICKVKNAFHAKKMHFVKKMLQKNPKRYIVT